MSGDQIDMPKVLPKTAKLKGTSGCALHFLCKKWLYRLLRIFTRTDTAPEKVGKGKFLCFQQHVCDVM